MNRGHEILEDIVGTVEILGKTLAIDKDGHLLIFGDWNEELAREIALREGIGELTDDHWTAIRYMRKVHEREGAPPSLRRLTKESGIDTKALYRLFPNGPAKKAAKIAGVPKPKSCV
jgi:tRNA 2-thiouridine synthesizing protein E